MPAGYYPRPPLEVLFWKKVDKTGECWKWTGAHFGNGYGNFRGRSAHRMAWTLTHGEIPPEIEICHTCPLRDCVRPEHLKLGTHAENMAETRGGNHWKRRRPWARKTKMGWYDHVETWIRIKLPT